MIMIIITFSSFPEPAPDIEIKEFKTMFAPIWGGTISGARDLGISSLGRKVTCPSEVCTSFLRKERLRGVVCLRGVLAGNCRKNHSKISRVGTCRVSSEQMLASGDPIGK